MFFLFILIYLTPLAFFLLKKRFDAVIKYFIISIFFLPIVVEKLYLPLAHTSVTFINIGILLFSLVLIFKNNLLTKKIFNYVALSLLILVIYIFISSSFRGHDFYTHIYFFRNFYFNLFLFSVLVSISNRNLDFDFEKFFFCIFGIQIVLALLQFNIYTISDFFKVTHVQKGGELVQRMDENFFHVKVVTGSLWSMGNFGNLMSILVVYFFGQLLLPPKYVPFKLGKNKLTFFVTLLGIFSVLLTGIRASLLSMAFGILFLLWLKSKRYFLGTLMGLIVSYISYSEIISKFAAGAAERSVGVESPFQRLSGIFVLFGESNSPDDYLTFGRTLELLDDFLQEPVFGVGSNFLFGDYESITDALLALMLFDLGTVGLLIIFLPYFFVLRYLWKYLPEEVFSILFVIFLMLCMQTVVDQGLFYLIANFVFLILCAYNIRKYRFNNNLSYKIESS